jgi:hypothetical protein
MIWKKKIYMMTWHFILHHINMALPIYPCHKFKIKIYLVLHVTIYIDYKTFHSNILIN